jgi:cytochrome c oxidase subunit 2
LAIEFRYRPGDETDGVPISDNFVLEIFSTAIPAILVIGVSIYSVEVFREMGGFDPGGGVTADIHNSVHAGHKMSQGSRIAAPQIADSPDGVPETAPEITPEITPTASSATYRQGGKPSETGQSAGITVNLTGI